MSDSTTHCPQMSAGAAEIVINPPAGAPMLGSIQRSTGVHDDLHARALVMNDGQMRVAIVCLDLIGMDFHLADEVCQAIRERSGIRAVLLNCSHTHSAPFTIPWSVLGWRWLAGAGKRWRDSLAPIIAELVAQAAAAAQKCTFRVGRAPVQIGFNRRLPTPSAIVMKPNPQGITVPWVDVLRIDRTDGTPAAILFSHAAHPVVVHGTSRLISADYPGFATHNLRKSFGDKTIAMFAQACGGQINAEPLRGGFGAAEHAGTILADAAFRAAENSESLPSEGFKFSSVRTELPLQPLPLHHECAALLDIAEQRLARYCTPTQFSDDELWDLQDKIDLSKRKSESATDDTQPMESQPWWLKDNVLCLCDLMNKIERHDDHSLRFDAHLLRIGDHWSLLAATHELFAEYQLWFDRNAPTKYNMMLGYTNGCESYLPTDKDLALDGYETVSFPSLAGAAFKYCHRRALLPGAEHQVKEKLKTLWA